MIPIILMVIGGLLFLYGWIWIIQIATSPLIVRWRHIRAEVELIDTGEVKKKRKSDRRFLSCWAIGFILSGALLFLAGWAYGFNLQGDGFWLNRFIEGEQGISDKWDRISDDGSYIAQDGTEYPYYLLVQGNTYEFCGETCKDLTDVQIRLSQIRRENTVMLIDSFAVSSKIKEAEKMLDEMRFNHETEEV